MVATGALLLADIHPQAGRPHRLRAPGMPVLQDLHHIDHLKRPPHHPPRLVSSTDLVERVPTGTADLPPTTPRPGAVIVDSVQVGNFVTGARELRLLCWIRGRLIR